MTSEDIIKNSITLNELFDKLYSLSFCDSFIVTLAYKYDCAKNYDISNEVLEYDGEINSYMWLNDWDEGQSDVRVLGFTRIWDLKTEPVNSDYYDKLKEDRK